MKKIVIHTARLRIEPRDLAEMERLHESEPDAEMKRAYAEMIELMRRLPGREEWACDWRISLPSGETIGGIGLKGMPDATGTVELGYGIDEPYRRCGYATEAARGVAEWALAQPGVRRVAAQTEPGNVISQRVLLGCGFVRDGDGSEGPLFARVGGEK